VKTLEDIEVLKKILEREDELNERYGKGNWRTRTITQSGNRLTLPLTKELEHLNVQGGETVIVGKTYINGRPVIIVEKL
jgi:hypothetical protein